MRHIHLCTGLLQRREQILAVASRYANHFKPLWNLPGGRQDARELLPRALEREFLEEVAMRVRVKELCYFSESYDGATHFTNATFRVESDDEPLVRGNDAHVVACEWLAADEIAGRMLVPVVREPLLAHLAGSGNTYFGYAEAGISIEFFD